MIYYYLVASIMFSLGFVLGKVGNRHVRVKCGEIEIEVHNTGELIELMDLMAKRNHPPSSSVN
jgi:hypothetical protein